MTTEPTHSRWSLPTRLESDAWWLFEPPKLRPTGTILPFIRRSPERGGTVLRPSRSAPPDRSAGWTV